VYAADLGSKDSMYNWDSTTPNENYFLLSTKRPDQFDWMRIIRFIRILSTFHIDTVCAAGYGRAAYLLIAVYARLSNRKVIMFAESWYASRAGIDVLKSLFFKWCYHRFLVSGIRAKEHFTNRLKIKDENVMIGYSVVDNDHFALPVDSKTTDHKKILLCVARFSPEKNLELLIRAFIKSELSQKGWELQLIGGGPLQNALSEQIMNQPIQLINWRPYEEIPKFYHGASAFVLPSSFEPWGLVVNEAMAASLPVILSERVGCLEDLLVPNENGWSFNGENENALIQVLNDLSNKTLDELGGMGALSKSIINRFSTNLFALNLKELIMNSSAK
jgi:glycosyltransferase involved in cell wall biosynthesis